MDRPTFDEDPLLRPGSLSTFHFAYQRRTQAPVSSSSPSPLPIAASSADLFVPSTPADGAQSMILGTPMIGTLLEEELNAITDFAPHLQKHDGGNGNGGGGEGKHNDANEGNGEGIKEKAKNEAEAEGTGAGAREGEEEGGDAFDHRDSFQLANGEWHFQFRKRSTAIVPTMNNNKQNALTAARPTLLAPSAPLPSLEQCLASLSTNPLPSPSPASIPISSPSAAPLSSSPPPSLSPLQTVLTFLSRSRLYRWRLAVGALPPLLDFSSPLYANAKAEEILERIDLLSVVCGSQREKYQRLTKLHLKEMKAEIKEEEGKKEEKTEEKTEETADKEGGEEAKEEGKEGNEEKEKTEAKEEENERKEEKAQNKNDDASDSKFHRSLKVLNLIRLDISRTFNEIPYFHPNSNNENNENNNENEEENEDSDAKSAKSASLEMLERVLMIYALENGGEEGYRQGYNELVAVLLLAIEYDYIVYEDVLKEITNLSASSSSSSSSSPSSSIDTAKLSSCIAKMFDRSCMEADLYTLFTYLMQALSPYYSAQFVQPKLNYIYHTLLSVLDHQLYTKLQSASVLPSVFLLRWLRLIFSRELSLNQTFYLWDYVFNGNNIEIIDLFAVSLLISQRERILSTDNDYLLPVLMKSEPSRIDVRSLCYIAESLVNGINKTKPFHANGLFGQNDPTSPPSASSPTASSPSSSTDFSSSSSSIPPMDANSTFTKTLSKKMAGFLSQASAALNEAMNSSNNSSSNGNEKNSEKRDEEISNWSPLLQLELIPAAGNGNCTIKGKASADSSLASLSLSPQQKTALEQLGIDWKHSLNANNQTILSPSAPAIRSVYFCSGYIKERDKSSSTSVFRRFQTRYIVLQQHHLAFSQMKLDVRQYDLCINEAQFKSNRFSLKAKEELGFISLIVAPVNGNGGNSNGNEANGKQKNNNELYEMKAMSSSNDSMASSSSPSSASSPSTDSSSSSSRPLVPAHVAAQESYSGKAEQNLYTAIPTPPRPPPLELEFQTMNRLDYLLWIGALQRVMKQ